jgi:hypothetical protein
MRHLELLLNKMKIQITTITRTSTKVWDLKTEKHPQDKNNFRFLPKMNGKNYLVKSQTNKQISI